MAKATLLNGVKARARTFCAFLTLVVLCAPVILVWALCAWLNHLAFGPSFETASSTKKKATETQNLLPKRRLRVLVTGGKMSKSSAVARAVGREGHEVFTAEISPYELCHTRFCKYVTRHYVLPRPTRQPKKWLSTIKNIVKKEKIDLIIPCTAPVESSAYAHLRKSLPSNVRVFALDARVSDLLDNKYTFNQVLLDAGIRCPETANMECLQDALEFFKSKEVEELESGKVSPTRYIVKPAVYDPKARTEILFLPIADKARQVEYLRSRGASKEVPYVIQEVLEAPEYGSFAIYNKGRLTGFEFFESCASCLRYIRADNPKFDQVLDLHRKLGEHLNMTGQITLDLMHDSEGNLLPIECNPRIHSAVCTLESRKWLGSAYADPTHTPSEPVLSKTTDAVKYWFADQIFLKLGFWKPKGAFQLGWSEMIRGKDALLHGDDPMPFLAMYLIQIPSLLLSELVAGTDWLKIDFCIGKIVKEGGD